MSELRQQIGRARLQLTRDLIFSLHAQANLVQDYSNDDANPNVSAYLRSGAVETLLEIEARAHAAGRRSRGYQPMRDGIDYDSSEQ